MLKKKRLLLLCLLGPATSSPVKFTSRSIMNISQVMPVDPTLYYMFNDHFTYDRDEVACNKLKDKMKHMGKETKSALNMVVWGGSSTNHDDMAKYLLPFGKTQLTVREGYQGGTNVNVDVPGNQDIVAENFNITTNQGNFCSTLNFKPKQTFVGVGFSGYCQLSNKIWLSFEAPVIHVKNTLDMVETVTYAGGGPVVNLGTPATEGFNNTSFVANMTDAFKNPNMLYGKIDGSQSKTAVAYVNLKVGYTYLQEEKRSLQLYGGLLLPTGNKPKGIYLFEPLVGNNKHFGLILGTYFTRRYEMKRFAVNVSADSDTEFLFANTQTRSFDLAGKPWSRYMGVYANNTQRLLDNATATAAFGLNSQIRYQTWGVNLFTQEVKVNPHFSTNLIINASFELPRNFAFDLGFKCFWQQDEHVTLKNPWQQGPIIGELSSDFTNVPGECTPARGINNMFSSIASTVPATVFYITEDQLDLTSATQPFRSDYTLYAATHKLCEFKNFKSCRLQLGTSYTFGSNNATANRWQVWLGSACYF
jgi:hypothetical protein